MAVMATLAGAQFVLGAFSSITSAKAQRRALKQAMKREAQTYKATLELAKNRTQLENLQTVETLNQVERRALKNRSTLTVSKGETLSGATYNALLQAHRKNELELKQQVQDRNVQKRIAMRERLVAEYTATQQRMSGLAAQNPSNSDIAMGIVGQALGSAANYFGTSEGEKLLNSWFSNEKLGK